MTPAVLRCWRCRWTRVALTLIMALAGGFGGWRVSDMGREDETRPWDY